MSCAVMFQPPESLRQRFYQQNDREILNDNLSNVKSQRSTSSVNTIAKYKPHFSCLTNAKMFHDQKHIPNKHNNAEEPISHFGGKGDKNLANYVLVKNYAGDVETVVDEHFTRALDSRKIEEYSKEKATTSRAFPPSYYQPFRESRSSYNNTGRYHPYYNLHTSDHWATMSSQEYKNFAHRGMYSESYSQLGVSYPYQYAFQSLQQPISKMGNSEFHSQTVKPEGWTSRHYETINNPYYQENGYEPTYTSPIHHGIESGLTQEYPKDLYWL